MKLLIVDDSGVIRNKIARGAAAKSFVLEQWQVATPTLPARGAS